MAKIQFYPDISDNNFQDIIYQKKEFHNNIIPKETRNYEEICRINKSDFSLLPQQKFLKNYLSIHTPYNGVLIFWGTGVGKTCAAVNIAENFIPYLKKTGKRVLVLVGKNIKENFKKNIFNFESKGQCTGDIYKDIDTQKYLTENQKKKELQDFIKKRYNFLGPLEFVNKVKNKIKDADGKDWDGKDKTLTPNMKNQIKKKYSNFIIIIDEVQNVGSSEAFGKESNIIPPILRNVIEYGQNNKLILMTATPMYDQARQIIHIINLLLLNDNRKPLDMHKIFDINSNLKEKGIPIFKEAIKGYISYIRDNKYSFPYKLFPSDLTTLVKKKYNLETQRFLPQNRIKYLKLIECPMNGFQLNAYNSLYSKTIVSKQNNSPNEEKKSSNKKNTLIGELIYNKNKKDLTFVSNIVYKDKTGAAVYKKKGITDNDNGLGGLFRQVKENKFTKEKRETYSYQKHSIYNYGKINEKPFLDEDHLWKYSSKMAKMLGILKKSKGIIFIYTEYISSGAIPLALMLEQNGYQPHGGKNLLNYNPKLAKKRLPRCYCCENDPSHKIHSKGHPNYHIWKQARYILFTGTINSEKGVKDKIIDKIIKSPDNLYGSDIKIIIGTKVISEGIDFSNIRQIHIFEPWYNMSRIQQVIGRGIRNCSHKLLKPEERNVEVFLYVASQAKKNGKKKNKYFEYETINERDYRIAEDKDIKIKKVERLMKEMAIDCNLNIETNIINDNTTVKLISSRGIKSTVSLEDIPFSRECDYMKNCAFKCNKKTPENIKINTDTYTYEHETSNMYKIKSLIQNLYRVSNIYKLSDIIENIKNEFKINDIYIYSTLKNILKNKDEIIDKYNRKGYIINKGHYYIFQPNEIPDENIPMFYRERPITIKHKHIKITSKMYDESVFKERNAKTKKNLSSANSYSNIYESVKKKIIVIEKIIDRNNLKKNSTIITELILEKLSNEDTVSLIKYTIENDINNDYYSKYYVNNKEGFWYGDNIYLKYIGNKKWDIYGKNEIRKIDQLKESFLKQQQPKLKNEEIIGQIVYEKKKYLFKIIDRSKYSEELTLSSKKSKRSFITGQTCNFFKKKNLDLIMKKINLKIKGNPVKKELCILIEYQLRLLEKQKKDGKKWFINRNEDIKYKE